MTLADLITLLQADCNGVADRNEILTLVDIVQKEMLNKDINFMRATPDVAIATTAGTNVYALPAGIRSCALVYQPLGTVGSAEYPYRSGDADPREVIKWAFVKDPGDGGPPNVLFAKAPGTTTYYGVCYQSVGELDSELAVLTVPEEFQTRYLRSRVMEILSQRRYGNDIYWGPIVKQHRGEWLRWAQDSGADPSSGSLTDYLTGNYGFKRRSSRWA